MKTLLFLVFYALAAVQGWAGEPTNYSDTIWTRSCNQDMGPVYFTPDSKYIITGGGGGFLDIWETSTGNIIKELNGYDSGLMILSSSGKYIAYGGGQDFDNGGFKVITYDTYQMKLIKSNMTVNSISFSPDEHFIAIASRYGFSVYDIETGNKVINKDSIFYKFGSNLGPGHLSYSPDGTHLVISMSDYSLRFYNISKDTIDYVYQGSNIIFNFSKDGTKLAFETTNNFISVMDLSTKQILGTTQNYFTNYEIHTLNFFDNDRYLLVSKDQTNAEIYDLTTYKRINIVAYGYSGGYTCVSNDNNYIAWAIGSYLTLFDLNKIVNVTELPKEIKSTLYPNPATKDINIILSDDVTKIRIIDNNGNIIKVINNPDIYSNNTLNINTNDFPTGSYIIQIMTVKQEDSYKLIINK